MKGDIWIVGIAVWLVLVCQAQAHGLYIEPWKHAANLTISFLVGTGTGVLVRKKCNLVVAVVAGILAGLLCSLVGLILSAVVSL
ncbi:MAG: hypothetical protein PCFJNLEI_01309 [Verrucomicrobiae bacterium]|nr:hypothetical protein [Verrucomicrobiae bacterium]